MTWNFLAGSLAFKDSEPTKISLKILSGQEGTFFVDSIAPKVIESARLPSGQSNVFFFLKIWKTRLRSKVFSLGGLWI